MQKVADRSTGMNEKYEERPTRGCGRGERKSCKKGTWIANIYLKAHQEETREEMCPQKQRNADRQRERERVRLRGKQQVSINDRMM